MAEQKPPFAVIDSRPFKNKTALKFYVSELLGIFPAGTVVPERHKAFLLGLLQRHHDAEAKVGCGVDHFFTRKHATYGTKGFWFKRLDGSEDDFSIGYCYETLTPAEVARRSFHRAAREPALEDCRRFRDAAPKVCAVSGVALARGEEHVDHAPPNTFEEILKGFALLYGGAEDHEYDCTTAGMCVFADPRTRADFKAYHNSLAELRLVTAAINLSGGSWETR